jgi:hypothetical protein
MLDNMLNESGTLMSLVRLIKMYLNETYSRVHIGKQLSDKFHIKNGLEQGYVLSPLLYNFAS